VEHAIPERRIGPWTAALLVVASMVGTGVFTTGGLLVRDLGSPVAVLVAWVVGGVAALCGALAYAELVAALPDNGGEYQLLARIYHPFAGFLVGWATFVVGFAAPVAASALAFSAYLDAVMPGIPRVPAGLALVAVTAIVHAVRVSHGSGFQNVFTAAKVALIVGFVGLGFAAGEPSLVLQGATRPLGSAIFSSAFAVGLIYVSFAYSGWNAAAYVAGEMREPARNVPRALLLGTFAVTALYVSLNYVFFAAAPAARLSGVVEVASVASTGLLGDLGGRVTSAIIALGLVSFVGAMTMTGPRVYEAMGRTYPRLRWLTVRRIGGGPVVAIALQSGLAAVMMLTASFDALLTYTGFVLTLGSAVTVAGVFVLRAREPGLVRPYRALWHPVTTLVYLALAVWMVIASVLERPAVVLAGLGTLALGALVYLLVRPRSPRKR